MSISEMTNLAEEMDRDLEAFIEEKLKESQNQPRYCNFDNMTTDEVVEELKQHPAFMTDFDETKPMSPALEALQILKYESQSSDESAVSYKEDGNKNFERGKYRWAIDNYTAGLNCNPSDKQIVTVLHSNRAASHYHIGNYRSSLNDCMAALNLTQNHKKSWSRALKCYKKLEKHLDVITWCDKALSLFSNEKEFLDARTISEQLLKKQERDERLAKAKEKKMLSEKLKIVGAIKTRNIRTVSKKNEDLELTEEEWVELVGEECNGARIQLVADETGSSHLTWPVLFLYPEHNQSDFIVAFHEESRFMDHLDIMFGGGTAPGWDEAKNYKPETIEIMIEERSQGDCKLRCIDPRMCLMEVMQSSLFKLTHSTLTFYLLIKNSEFKKSFIKSFGK